MPRDITVTLEDGSSHVYKNAPDSVTPEQVQARAEQEFGLGVKALDGGKPKSGLEKAAHMAKVGGAALFRGLAGLPSMLAGGSAADYNERAYGAGSFVQPDQGTLPLDPTLPGKQVAGVGPRPSTTGERYLSSALEGVGGAAIGPGGLAKNAAIGLGAGLGSEAAGQATSQNPLARLLGGLVGGGGVATYQALKPNATNLIKTATKGVTDADWLQAKSVEMALDDMGMPHLKSQLLGPNSSLDDVVRDASANQRVRPSLLKALRDTSGKAGRAFEVWANQHLPIQADERRDFLANLQRIASEKEAELLAQKNTVFASKLKPGLDGEVYPEQYMQSLRKELLDASRKGAEGFGNATDGGRFLQQYISDKLGTKGNGMSKTELGNLYNEINAYGAANNYSGKAIRHLKNVIGSYTKDDFGDARKAATDFFESTVNPMRQGLAGDLAHAKGGPRGDRYTATEATLGNVFPADKAQPLAIKKLAEDVGGEQVGLLLREQLSKNFEQAAKRTHEMEGTPASFVEAALGTPAQRSNIESALMESAKAQGQNPFAVKAGFQKMVNAFATYRDLKISPSVSPTNLQIEAGKSVAGAAVAPHSKVARYLSERATAGTYQKIADMVSSKDGLAQLEKIAKSQDPAYLQAIVRGMLATGEGNPDGLQSSNPPK